MKLKNIVCITIVCTLLSLIGCEKKITPMFTFSPTAPKAGEKITFTNSTSEGEVWNWYFGDETESTYKSPTKTYKTAGVYDVTLMVDSNSNYVRTQQITVYDTIPTIMLDVENINYYEEFTLSALVYNPFDYEVTYKWEFSDNAKGEDIENNISEEEEVTLLYTQHSINEKIQLTLTVGDSIYVVEKNMKVHDVPAHSLLMAAPGEKLISQRIYEVGLEAHKVLEYTVPSTTNSLQVNNSVAYLFATGDANETPKIEALALGSLSTITVISSTQAGSNYEFNNGYVTNSAIYWTDRNDFIYQIGKSAKDSAFAYAGSAEAQKTSPYYVASAGSISGMTTGITSSSIALHDNTYFWSKRNNGKGVYRFTPNDIKAGRLADVILSDYSIQTLVIDQMNTKIYFIDDAGTLYASGIDGNSPYALTDACTGGLAIDNATDRVFFTKSDKVEYMRLVKASNNKPTGSAQLFYEGAGIKTIAIDKVKR